MESKVFKTKYRRYKVKSCGSIWHIVYKPVGIYHLLFKSWRIIKKFDRYRDGMLALRNELIFDRLEDDNISWSSLNEAKIKYSKL